MYEKELESEFEWDYEEEYDCMGECKYNTTVCKGINLILSPQNTAPPQKFLVQLYSRFYDPDEEMWYSNVRIWKCLQIYPNIGLFLCDELKLNPTP